MEKLLRIPEGYQTVMAYLIIPNAEQFISFTQKVFNAEEKMRHMRSENSIMHGEIVIGECTIMVADATEQFPVRNAGFFIYVADADVTYQLALASGATSIAEPANQPYGRSGGITDPFGNQWWITSVIE